MYDYQTISQVVDAHRQDLITEAKIYRLAKADRTATTRTRAERRLSGWGLRRLRAA